jgi:hypothetical protein
VQAHLEQHAVTSETARGEQLGRARKVPVRPHGERSGAGHFEDPVQQGGAESAAPERRVHDQFGGPVVEPRVAGEGAVGVADQEIPPTRRPAVPEP